MGQKMCNVRLLKKKKKKKIDLKERVSRQPLGSVGACAHGGQGLSVDVTFALM